MTIREKKEIILKYLQNNPWLNNTQIARKIIKESKKFSSDEVDNLRRAIGKVRNKIEDIEIVATEELPKYIVQDGNYYWENKNGKISLSVEFIDSLFYEYSEYGLNLTQTEVINKYNLQVWEWNSIKSTLWLFKKSNIFSPYTVENTPVDQLEGMIAAKISGMLNNTGLQVEKQ